MVKIAFVFILLATLGSPVNQKSKHNLDFKDDSTLPSSKLFESDDILDLTIRGDINSLFKDRSDKMEYHPMVLTYTAEDSSLVNHELKIKTRGHFRRSRVNCVYPPLLLNFSKEKTPPQSLFENEGKLKLVTPCSDDKYVIREYLVYKLYNLLTDKSYKARLVRVIYDDTVKNKKTKPLFGILLEDDDHMARRNNAVVIETQLVKPQQTENEIFLTTAVFEYMIANTDWSVQYRQNITLMGTDTMVIPMTVPYDFDHAGIVSTPYAKPEEALELSSVRQRRYRGYCMPNLAKFKETFALFNREKDNLYRVYSDNKLLDEKYIKSTLQFLDEFYETINNEKNIKNVFSYPCLEDGTGNVVIKGLGKN